MDLDYTEQQALDLARAARLYEEAMRTTGTGEACDRAERLMHESQAIRARYDSPEPPRRDIWDRPTRFSGWD